MFFLFKLVNVVVQCLFDIIEQGCWVVGQMLFGQCELVEQMEISWLSLCEVIMVLEILGVVCLLLGKGVMVFECSELLCEVVVFGEVIMEDVL